MQRKRRIIKRNIRNLRIESTDYAQYAYCFVLAKKLMVTKLGTGGGNAHNSFVLAKKLMVTKRITL